MITNDSLYWIGLIDYKKLSPILSNKRLYVWGAFSKGKVVCEDIEKHGFIVEGFLDMYRSENYCDKKVLNPNDILDFKEDVFVFVAIEGIRNEIVNWLQTNSLTEEENYLYLSKMVPEIEISSLRGKYEDKYDNCFEYLSSSYLNGVRINCKGGHNFISVDDNISFANDGKLIINASYGSSIHIGKNFHVEGTIVFHAQFGGTIEIGDGVNIEGEGVIYSTYGSKVNIGNKTSIGRRFFVSAGINSPVSIGFDCMISHDVSIHGTNEHSILDLSNKQSISLNREKPICIDKHVWLCKNATIMYGTTIGEGCVVGACSLVKGDYPSKCTIAGNIAKVVHTNCTWDRRKDIDFNDF